MKIGDPLTLRLCLVGRNWGDFNGREREGRKDISSVWLILWRRTVWNRGGNNGGRGGKLNRLK